MIVQTETAVDQLPWDWGAFIQKQAQVHQTVEREQSEIKRELLRKNYLQTWAQQIQHNQRSREQQRQRDIQADLQRLDQQ